MRGHRTRVTTFNVRGLTQRMNEIEDLMRERRIMILVVTDTMLPADKSVSTSMKVEAIARTPRPGTRVQGGVAILTHRLTLQTVVYKRITETIETIAVRVGGIVLVGMYCRPTTSRTDLTAELEFADAKTSGKVIIMRDFNARSIA